MAETESVSAERVKAYKIILSIGNDIQIDADEVAKVIEGIKSGSVVRVKQGFFNPSYFVAIIEDKERIRIFLEDTKYDTPRRNLGMKSLKDILKNVQLKVLPERTHTMEELPSSHSEHDYG